MPGCIESYHFAIYLPTAGLEAEFVSALAVVDIMVSDIYEQHDGECPIFLRGDANCSSKNPLRSSLLKSFLKKHDLHRVHLPHPTYHHFVGEGLFDSDLDVLIFSNVPDFSKKVSDPFSSQVDLPPQ